MRTRRHPAEVTADRLADAYEKYFEHYMERIIDTLREIAEATR